MRQYSHDGAVVNTDSCYLQSNVLISRREDGNYQLRITDFGIAKIEQIYTQEWTTTCKGAIRWMAPEILDPPAGCSSQTTPMSDVYAYAMTCVEVIDISLSQKISEFTVGFHWECPVRSFETRRKCVTSSSHQEMQTGKACPWIACIQKKLRGPRLVLDQ